MSYPTSNIHVHFEIVFRNPMEHTKFFNCNSTYLDYGQPFTEMQLFTRKSYKL